MARLARMVRACVASGVGISSESVLLSGGGVGILPGSVKAGFAGGESSSTEGL